MSRLLSLLALGVLVAPVSGQTLERRVAGAGDGAVQFHFAAREGVCGNGRSFLRADESGYYTSINNGNGAENLCLKGPIRAVVVRAGREIVRIETYAGPLGNDPEGGQDLGAVSAREAAGYLLGLAISLDGRPARDAILPAMLADSAVVTTQLLQVTKDQNRSRDLRRSAISWLARRRAESGGVGVAAIMRALDQLVKDRTESESIRQSALSTISGLERGEGIPVLIGFAADADPWLAKQSFSTLSRSGDPRARQFVRDAVRKSDLAEESRVAAIQGLGNDYATAADLKALRDLYPTLRTDRERDALISAVASAGGSENATWLLTIAKSQTEPAQRRRRAVTLLSRFDDPRVKDALKELVDR